MATISSGNSTTLYSTTQTSTSVNTPSTVPTQQVNETNFTTLYSNTSASTTGGGVSGNLLVSGNLRVLGTSDLEGSVTISNSYVLPTSDGTNNQVVTTDGNGNLTFQDVDAIDNIPDGTAKGQVLFWNGSAWTAATTLTFDAVANRLRLVNNVSGLSAAVEFLKQYTTTLADGAKVGHLFGFTSGGAIVSPTNPIYTHRTQSEYDTGGNPIYRISADPVGNFASGSTTVYTVSSLDNDLLGINGNEFIFLLNETGAPTEDAVIRVNRGTSTDATITWDETDDRFEINNDLLTTGVQGGNVQIAMTGQTDNTIYIGGNDLQINTDGAHIIQSNSPIKTSAEIISINSDSTAADSYLYLKGTSVAVKYNNTTDFIELPRTAIDNICIDNNTIFSSSGDITIDADSGNIYFDTNMYVNGIYEQYGEYIKINKDSSNFDSYLYMKGTAKFLQWDEANQFFRFSNTLYGNDDIIAEDNLATNGNNIWFNYDDVSAADSYLTVKRGASADVSVRWNQATSRWQFTNDGSTYYNMVINIDDLADVNITAVAEGNTLYYDATTGFWRNTAIVTVDDVNSRVGINVASPTVALDVSGDVKLSGVLTVTGNEIKSSTGSTAIHLDNNSIRVAGNVTIDGNAIKSNGGTTAITMSSANVTVAGDLAVNGDDLTTTQTTFNLLNATATTLNIGGASTVTAIGSTASGTTTIGYDLVVNNNVNADSYIVDSISTYNTQTTTTTSTAAVSISATTRPSQKSIIKIIDNVTGEIHMLEALAFRKSTTAYLTTYAEIYSNAALATFTATGTGGTTSIIATPLSTNSTTFTVARFSLD